MKSIHECIHFPMRNLFAYAFFVCVFIPGTIIADALYGGVSFL